MKEDYEKGLSLLQEILTTPRFDSQVLDVAKEQALTALRRQGGDAQSVAAREAMIWHYKDHVYGRDPLKSLETIPNIAREDLLLFLRQYFVPSNMVAAVSGDIEKDAVIQGLRKLFKALPATEAPQRQIEDPISTPPVLAFIHKPGQVQSQVILVVDSVKRTHPDYWKISLLMDIFGGSDSLLYKRLRDDLGLVYSAGFYQTYKWRAGMLIGYIGCKGDKTVSALEESISIMKSLHQQVPGGELEQKRLDAMNSFVFNVDTPFELVKVYGRYYMRKEPLDTLGRIQDSFLTVQKGELTSLARKFLRPANLQIFIVGDKDIQVHRDGAEDLTLGKDLTALAKRLGIPFKEIVLR
jgi:predicted Zn-dependent peptidase